MHYYDHHISDFLTATDWLDHEQRFIYLRLIWHYYDRESAIENHPEKLAARFKTSVENIELILAEFFTLEDDNCYHKKRIDSDIKKYHLRINAAKRAGRESGKVRRGAALERTLNQPSTNLEPTNNQQPITNNHNKKKQAKKRTVFKPPKLAEVSAYMAEIGASGFSAEKFISHYESNGWMVGKTKMKDWRAAVRGWNARRKDEQPAKQGERKRPKYDQAGNVIPGEFVRY